MVEADDYLFNQDVVIAASLDPITNGHRWLIMQALRMFRRVHIAIAVNPSKQGMFKPQERVELVKLSIFEMVLANRLDQSVMSRINVEILSPTRLVVNFAQEVGARHILRGIRNSTDFEFEHQLNLINKTIDDDVETIYLMPPREMIEISSSMVKNLVGLDGWEAIARRYVPQCVLAALIQRQRDRLKAENLGNAVAQTG